MCGENEGEGTNVGRERAIHAKRSDVLFKMECFHCQVLCSLVPSLSAPHSSISSPTKFDIDLNVLVTSHAVNSKTRVSRVKPVEPETLATPMALLMQLRILQKLLPGVSPPSRFLSAVDVAFWSSTRNSLFGGAPDETGNVQEGVL